MMNPKGEKDDPPAERDGMNRRLGKGEPDVLT